MKCYTIKNINMKPYIEVTERQSKKTGGKFYAAEVGERGRGRELQFVALHPSFQPTKEGNRLFITEANVAKTKSGGHILVPTKETDNLALIKVYGVEGYRGALRYSFSNPNPEIIAKGYHAQGDAGRMGGGSEYLVVMLPNDKIEIQRLGRLYGDNERISIEWDGSELRVYDPDAEPDLELDVE